MKSKLLLPVIPAPRRGRYRADRPTVNGTRALSGHCGDCRWLGDRVADGRNVDAYLALLLRHFEARHDGAR